jgi:hypothetical protein
MPDEFDPYQPNFPNLKNNFDGVVAFGRFNTGDFGMAYQPILEATDQDIVEPRYGVGRGWTSADGGATVRHESGRDNVGFDDGTAYMDLIVHMMDAGAKDILYQRYDAGLGPRFAENYNNLIFHWEITKRPVRRPASNEDGTPKLDEQGRRVWEDQTINRLLPTKYLGVDEAHGGVAVPSAATQDPLSALSSEDQEKVVRAALDSGSYFQFIDALRGLTDSNGQTMISVEEIRQALATEEWYTSLRDRR